MTESPYLLVCPHPCAACGPEKCDPICAACWRPANSLDPGMHVFEITVRSRLGSPTGEYFPDLPSFGIQVRAYNLPDAMRAAAEVPLLRWFPDDTDLDPNPEPS